MSDLLSGYVSTFNNALNAMCQPLIILSDAWQAGIDKLHAKASGLLTGNGSVPFTGVGAGAFSTAITHGHDAAGSTLGTVDAAVKALQDCHTTISSVTQAAEAQCDNEFLLSCALGDLAPNDVITRGQEAVQESLANIGRWIVNQINAGDPRVLSQVPGAAAAAQTAQETGIPVSGDGSNFLGNLPQTLTSWGRDISDAWAQCQKVLAGQSSHLETQAAKVQQASAAHAQTTGTATQGKKTQIPATTLNGQAVKDLWATQGSYTVKDASIATSAYHKWYAETSKHINQMESHLKKDGVQFQDFEKLRAWLTQYDAHERWKALKQGPEPPDPGQMPHGITHQPPQVTYQAGKEYAIRMPGSDQTITYTDHVMDPSRLGSIYYRQTNGVRVGGRKLNTLPNLDQLLKGAGITNTTEIKATKAVSAQEAGFEGVNTYDAGYISVGMIQFISGKDGKGSLAGVLERLKANSPGDFTNYFQKFGIDVVQDPKDHKYVIQAADPATGEILTGEKAVQAIIDDKRLTEVFHNAGLHSQAFQEAQLQIAHDSYYTPDKHFSVTVDGTTISGKMGDVLRSEAGLTAMLDRNVQHGSSIGVFDKAVADVMKQYHVKTLDDLAKYEKLIIPHIQNRIDVLNDTSLEQPADPPR
jgi:hypothetical protein